MRTHTWEEGESRIRKAVGQEGALSHTHSRARHRAGKSDWWKEGAGVQAREDRASSGGERTKRAGRKPERGPWTWQF